LKWNNAKLQQNAAGISFSFVQTVTETGRATSTTSSWTHDSGTNAEGELNLCLNGNNPGQWVTSDQVSYGPLVLYVNFGPPPVWWTRFD
jgi:hypothetical protein